nr:hypothetical protein [Tanacetum cinerariifolium]
MAFKDFLSPCRSSGAYRATGGEHSRFRGISSPGKLMIHFGSVAARIKARKCRTRGSSKSLVKRRLVQAVSSLRATRLPDVLELHNANACHLKISAITLLAWKDFDNNPHVKVLLEKIADVFIEVKEHKASLGRILLKSKMWAGYHVILSTLESKVASLEAEKAKLEATEAKRLGARVYYSWKLQGDVEGLWDEFAKLEASMKMWESLVEPRHS